MRTIKTLICYSVISLTASCAIAQVRNDQTEWKVFASPDCGFRASFPIDPTKLVRDVPGANGTIQSVQFFATLPHITYMVTYGEQANAAAADDAGLNANYDLLRDGVAKSTSSKLLNDREVRAGKYLGREIQLRTGNQIVKYRMFLIGKRQYQVITSCDAPYCDNAETNRNVDRFLNSFELID